MSMECTWGTWYRVDLIDPNVLWLCHGHGTLPLKKCNDGKLFNITWVGRGGGGVIGTLNIPIQYLKKLFVHSLIKPSRTFLHRSIVSKYVLATL